MTEAQHEVSLLGDWLSWDPASLPPSRWSLIVPLLTWVFANQRPSLGVELGSRDGATFRALCQIGERFSPRGRLVAIDAWAAEQRNLPLARSAYEGLRDHCQARHAGRASVICAEPLAAASEFDGASIDFLHIARVDDTVASSSFDLSLWAPKLSDHAVVVITGADEHEMDDATRKVWQQLSDAYPSVLIRLPRPVGIAQRPHDGEAPLVEFVESASEELSSLFRLLGERTAFRHVIGSEPLSEGGIRSYISGLMQDHAEDLRRVHKRHQLQIESLEHRLASVTDRSFETSAQLTELQVEADLLLALLARRSATYEEDSTRLRAMVDELEAKVAEQHSTSQQLAVTLAERDSHIAAIANTVSWRVTKPLRTIQARLIRAKIVRRSR